MMFSILMMIVFGYLLGSIVKYKLIPTSISETFYLGNKYWFTFTLWVISILLSICLMDVTNSSYQFLVFLTSAGLAFVGAAAHFKDKTEGLVHYAGAGLFAVCSQIWAALYCSPWILTLWASTPLWVFTKQRVFYAELLCIIVICIAFLI